MKGMQKVSRGSSFRGCLKYGFERKDGKDQGILIGGTMAGTSINSLSTEFGRFRKLREDITKPVWHNSLRLPEGESLDSETWNKIGNDYMKRMGFDEDKNQYAFILHDDDHIHIVANRIDINGKLWYGKNENIESTRHIAQLEKDYGLTITKNLDYTQDELGNWKTAPGQTNLTKVNISRKERHMDIVNENKEFNDNKFYEGSARTRLTNRINEVLADGNISTMDFIKRIEENEKVKVYATIKLGDMAGFSFRFEDRSFKGSEVGANWKELITTKGVNYDKSRDLTELQNPSRRFSNIKSEDRQPKSKVRKPTAANNPNRDNTGQFSTSREGTGDIERDLPYKQPDVKNDAATVQRDNDLSKQISDSIREPTSQRVSTNDVHVKRVSPIVPNISEQKPANGERRPNITKSISETTRRSNGKSVSHTWDNSLNIKITDSPLDTPLYPILASSLSSTNGMDDDDTARHTGKPDIHGTYNKNHADATTTSSATPSTSTTSAASTAAKEWEEWEDSTKTSVLGERLNSLIEYRLWRASLNSKDIETEDELVRLEYKKSPEERLQNIYKCIEKLNDTPLLKQQHYEVLLTNSYTRVDYKQATIDALAAAIKKHELEKLKDETPTQDDIDLHNEFSQEAIKLERKLAGKDWSRPDSENTKPR